MADTSYSDLGLVYNHPSIISTITNNDTIFTSTSGNRPFFCVIASERGEDNKIKMISSTKEFLFEYGEPNLKLYGQQNYNVMNILQNGETVYVLRVLPDNAGFSHAMLNLQTKINGTKKVKSSEIDKTTNEHKLIDIDDVFIRPTVTYSKANNSSKTLLEYELTSNTGETIDGYKNNPLFFVIPKGRGKYYDSFGFRLYLNKSYDNSYDFRVYNFEVIQYDEYDNPSVIEGPFYVSLDPDALTESNQSMFIEDVVNRYSDYLQVIYNEEAYDYVTSLINPDVNPAHIDILGGITKEVDNETETFFDEKTGLYQDIHYRLFEYDDSGNVITNGVNPISNIIGTDDEVENSIIDLDNTSRDTDYNIAKESLENIKNGIVSLNNKKYLSNLKAKLGEVKDTSMKELIDGDSTHSGYTIIKSTDIPAYNAIENKSESDYATLLDKMSWVEGKIESLLSKLSYIKDNIYLVDNESPDILLQIETFISAVRKNLTAKDSISIKLISYESSIEKIIKEVTRIEALQNMDDEVSELKILLTEIRSMVGYLSKILPNYDSMTVGKKEEELSESEKYKLLSDIQKDYNKIIDDITFVSEEFNPDEDKEEKLLEVYSIINGSKSNKSFLENIKKLLYLLVLSNEESLLTKLMGETISDEEGTEITTGTYKGYLGAIITLEDGRVTKIEDVLSTKSTTDFVENAKSRYEIQKDKVSQTKNLIYTTQLQDTDLPIRFKFGSEGDLDESNLVLKNKTFDNLLIKGYKGNIDDGITSKKIIPARFIIDANYSVNVKNAMHLLATEIRDDIFFYCDLGFTSSPEDALSIRNTTVNFSANTVAIYAQDFTVYDEYTGRDIRVTTPYYLSSKIPYCAVNYGLHYPIAGNKRGLIDGFKSISWTPNEAYKELLYNKKVNYIESDNIKTRFGSQLTSEMRNTPLSNINNVITVIDIKNDVELMAENYQFEFNESETINAFQSELNSYLSKYTSSKAVERIEASVYSSDYDKLQKILRVSITIKFYDIIERILINLDVVKQ